MLPAPAGFFVSASKGEEMFDSSRVRQDVEDYITNGPKEFWDDFDVDGIVDDLSDIAPNATCIDDIDYDDFVVILQKHDVSGRA